MKKIFILFIVCCNIKLIAKEIYLQPNFGLFTTHYVGNGTASATAIVRGFDVFNNPFNNKYNSGLSYGLDLGLVINKKSSIQLSTEYHKINYTIYLNRTYELDGTWRPINGYLTTYNQALQFYISYLKTVYLKNNFKIVTELGVSPYFSNMFIKNESNQELYDGTKQQLIYNSTTVNRTYVIPNASIPVFVGVYTYYKNYFIKFQLKQGVQNLYRGNYKATHNDGQNFLILPQAFNATLGYRINFNKKNKD